MVSSVLKAVFGSRNDRLLKQYAKTVKAINALEPAMAALDDRALAAKTPELKQRFARSIEGVPADGRDEAEKAALAELLPDAFAVVREAAKRVLRMRHSTCSWSAAWCSTMARSPRCAPGRARLWSRPCPRT
jgi:preprotein translocase subunit SecA